MGLCDDYLTRCPHPACRGGVVDRIMDYEWKGEAPCPKCGGKGYIKQSVKKRADLKKAMDAAAKALKEKFR